MNTQSKLTLGLWTLVFSTVLAGAGWWVYSISTNEPPVRRIKPAAKEPPVERVKRPNPPPDDFVGSVACKQCHAKVYESYQSHPMSQAVTATFSDGGLKEHTVETSFEISGGTSYRVERTPDGVFHHETHKDKNGVELFSRRVRVDYAVGSGKRGKSYIVDRGGLLFQSPISWYAGSNRWDLSPGYKPNDNPHFGRRIRDECISCHAGRLASIRGQGSRFRQPAILEHTISCERCHGPGKRHVEYRQLDARPARPDPIVNPSKLDVRRREAVCNQCHLHGEGKILRYGRGEYDFRPGMNLEDIWTAFVRGHRVEGEATKAVSQVEQMRSSACYLKGDRQMGCISCHDPHGSPAPAQRVAFYRKKCNQCHEKPDVAECSAPLVERRKPPVSNSCIACHMPRLSAKDVPHTSQTDHRVPRRPEKDPIVRKISTAVTIFDDADKRLPKVAVQRARGLFLAKEADDERDALSATKAIELLEPILLSSMPDDVTSLYYLGACFRVHSRDKDARRVWEHALKIQPKHETLLEKVAVLCHETKDYKAGVEYLDRLLAINPWLPHLYGRRAQMLANLQKVDLGIKSAEKALELDPTMANVHQFLSVMYRLQQNDEKSRHHESMWKRLQPAP